MGFTWGGTCHQTNADALDQFKVDMVTGDAHGLSEFTSVPTISGTGLVTWAIRHHDFSTNQSASRSGTLQLQACNEGIAQWEISPLFWVAVIFFAAVVGFRTGFRP